MNSTDPLPHKRDPIPFFSLDLVDYVLIYGIGAMIIWWWGWIMYT